MLPETAKCRTNYWQRADIESISKKEAEFGFGTDTSEWHRKW